LSRFFVSAYLTSRYQKSIIGIGPLNLIDTNNRVDFWYWLLKWADTNNRFFYWLLKWTDTNNRFSRMIMLKSILYLNILKFIFFYTNDYVDKILYI
jgi:hypothetical protein